MRVVIKLSDPWEVGEALGWPTISGTVAHSDTVSWLVELDRPFIHASAQYRFLVVSSRHEDKSLAHAVSEEVSCNMIRTTPGRASSESPCDVSWWRGSHALIGSIRADPTEAAAPLIADVSRPRFMKELAEVIESRPLFAEACRVMLKCFGSRAWELQEFVYCAPAFGSMHAVYRCNGKCFRVVWDGRDAAVSVEMADGHKPGAPHTWNDLALAKDVSSLSGVEEKVTNELASKA